MDVTSPTLTVLVLVASTASADITIEIMPVGDAGSPADDNGNGSVA